MVMVTMIVIMVVRFFRRRRLYFRFGREKLIHVVGDPFFQLLIFIVSRHDWPQKLGLLCLLQLDFDFDEGVEDGRL